MDSRRRVYGQHFLQDHLIAQKIVDAGQIENTETVCELGTGKGILTKELAERAKIVYSYEIDKTLFNESLNLCKRYSNLEIINQDFFESDNIGNFDIFVSNVPYSRSRDLIKWLALNDFNRAIIMCQKEFVDKLLTSTKKYRAISVLAQYKFDIVRLFTVNKSCFHPIPEVESEVIKILPKYNRTITISTIKNINLLLSYKNKKLKNVLRILGIDQQKISATLLERKVKELQSDCLVQLANNIASV